MTFCISLDKECPTPGVDTLVLVQIYSSDSHLSIWGEPSEGSGSCFDVSEWEATQSEEIYISIVQLQWIDKTKGPTEEIMGHLHGWFSILPGAYS